MKHKVTFSTQNTHAVAAWANNNLGVHSIIFEPVVNSHKIYHREFKGHIVHMKCANDNYVRKVKTWFSAR